jgi:hypothetical protein
VIDANGDETYLHEEMIRRAPAIIGSAIFLVIAPGFVAGLVPGLFPVLLIVLIVR